MIWDGTWMLCLPPIWIKVLKSTLVVSHVELFPENKFLILLDPFNTDEISWCTRLQIRSAVILSFECFKLCIFLMCLSHWFWVGIGEFGGMYNIQVFGAHKWNSLILALAASLIYFHSTRCVVCMHFSISWGCCSWWSSCFSSIRHISRIFDYLMIFVIIFSTKINMWLYNT